ncbi:MAG: HU family DNA-binding protein [Prevotellaceae bacterium]|nr:HU family DNA-binding protein [Prevotella sp.]MDD7258240.1 HU family DNA-binding protein [Prevotellaceae bacterium]MDY6130578.1 HU family DNA-binding protein [Prevotella sp.]
MNNKALIQELSQRSGFTQEDTQNMVNTLIDAMNERFMESETVFVPGFGTFEVKRRMERIVVNPVTQQRMLVPPKLVLGFKPIAAMKKVLKQGGLDDG